MTCVREPSDGDEVDGPFAIAVRFDMMVVGIVAVEMSESCKATLIQTFVISAPTRNRSNRQNVLRSPSLSLL